MRLSPLASRGFVLNLSLCLFPALPCAACGAPPERDAGLADALPAILETVEKLENRELMYSPRPSRRRDCSGIFHRTLEALKKRCPDLDVPSLEESRSSAQLATWYDERDALAWVDDPLSQDARITPGTALFYGSGSSGVRSIHHVGIVTEVERGEDGQVVSYGLFHGRSAGKPAAVTRYHRRAPGAGLPPLGNGPQHWIAAAPLCSGVACLCR